MDGVDRGYQLSQHDAGFSAKDHFKKWYKRGKFGLGNFGFLNSHIAWNLSYESMVHIGKVLRQPPKNWDSFVVAAEAMMAYYAVDLQDNDSVDNIAYEITRLRRDGNCPCLDLSELKQQRNAKQFSLICSVCAVE